jgi:hypothetical protein
MSETEMQSIMSHVSVGTNDVKKSGIFYDALLAPLGAVRVFNEEEFGIGYGKKNGQNSGCNCRLISKQLPQQTVFIFAFKRRIARRLMLFMQQA